MLSIPRGISLLCLTLAPLAAQDIKIPPALGARAVEKVDITLDSNLLQFAGKFLSDSKGEEADVKKLLAGLKSIYVRTFEYEKPGEYNQADVDSVRAQFRGPGWSRIAGVESKKEKENAEVFLMTDKAGKVGGFAVIAAEPKELTIVSIVGAIDPAQFGALTGKFGIPKIELEKKKKSGKDD
jgi:Domain of unknown function (DUF4252)